VALAAPFSLDAAAGPAYSGVRAGAGRPRPPRPVTFPRRLQIGSQGASWARRRPGAPRAGACPGGPAPAPRAPERLLGTHRAHPRQLVELRLDPRLPARVDPPDVVREAQPEAVRRLPESLREPGWPAVDRPARP